MPILKGLIFGRWRPRPGFVRLESHKCTGSSARRTADSGSRRDVGLLDTGAEVTCVDPKLVEDLELPYDGPVLANVPSLNHATFASQYDASLTILHPSGDQQAHLAISDLFRSRIAAPHDWISGRDRA